MATPLPWEHPSSSKGQLQHSIDAQDQVSRSTATDNHSAVMGKFKSLPGLHTMAADHGGFVQNKRGNKKSHVAL